MKKWQEFLLFFVLFVLFDVPYDLTKHYSENSIIFLAVAMAIFVIGWGIVLVERNLLLKKNKTNKNSVSLFTYFMLLWSTLMTFDVTQYLLKNNILNKYYFIVIGIVLMLLGYISGRLDSAKKDKKLI